MEKGSVNIVTNSNNCSSLSTQTLYNKEHFKKYNVTLCVFPENNFSLLSSLVDDQRKFELR